MSFAQIAISNMSYVMRSSMGKHIAERCVRFVAGYVTVVMRTGGWSVLSSIPECTVIGADSFWFKAV